MRAEARLDSVIFQLTPTRTRCELVITANGKTEKIASGLLKPFLDHLNTAREQIAKGGYSIALEPGPRLDAVWFTKGTMERFVRFVSNPEVLERVCTIESEIMQIGIAISIQGNDNLGFNAVEGHHQTRATKCIEGNKPAIDADVAIVLYEQPAPHPNPQGSNVCAKQEDNSRVHLLRVLETRKMVLQNEQGMAFARATAAGFDMDHMGHLMAFAECFGASRLMEACIRFMELWKGKHDNGQWLEIEVTEAISSQSKFCPLNASGITLSEDCRQQKESGEAWSMFDLGTENSSRTDKSRPSDPQVPLGTHEHSKGQFPHSTLPHWPMHPPLIFQPYPVQDRPYYQSYPCNGPHFQAPYPPMQDPWVKRPTKMRQRRQSVYSKNGCAESDTTDKSFPGSSFQDDVDHMSYLERETSQDRKSHRRQSGGLFVHKNNYINSKGHEASEKGSQSTSDSETVMETENLQSNMPKEKHKNQSKPLNIKAIEASNTCSKHEVVNGQEVDYENWQVFQSFLLRAEEKTSSASADTFAGEKGTPAKTRLNKIENDSTLLTGNDSDTLHGPKIVEFDLVNDKGRRIKQLASKDELLMSNEGRVSRDRYLDSHAKKIEEGGGGYMRGTRDDFLIYGQRKKLGKQSLKPVVEYEYEHADNLGKSSDDSFMVPVRSTTQDQLGSYSRTTFNMDSKLPSAPKRTQKSCNRMKNQPRYEPDVLILMPERLTMNNGYVGYNPARDCDIQIPRGDSSKLESRNQESIPISTNIRTQRLDKQKMSKLSQNGVEKRNKDAQTKKGTSSKLNPGAEAQKRAEKLRAYKADLQKVKKEKEEEEVNRLEALKRERQKRISARSSSNTAQSPLTLTQSRARLPTKLSPSSYRGSKFSDSEPKYSPLRSVPVRTTSVGFTGSPCVTKFARLNGGNNGLSRSVISLPELKKKPIGPMVATRADSIRAKKVSDPKGSNMHRGPSMKSVRSDKVPKQSTADDPQMKISAIIQLDKSKSATLPELKIRTSRSSSDAVQKSASKGTGCRTALVSGSVQPKRSMENGPRVSNIDNPVIEKKVMLLGNEKVPAPIVQVSQDITHIIHKSDVDDRTLEVGLDSEYMAIHAPPSLIVDGEVGDTIDSKLNGRVNTSEVQKLSNSKAAVKSYETLYARATSLANPATNIADQTARPPVLISKPSFSCSVDLCSAEQTQEMSKKIQSKEVKGFRKLIKFGRRATA